MPTNILENLREDGIKAALKGIITLVKGLFPPSKEVIESFEKLELAIEHGTVTIDNFEESILSILTFIEIFTNDQIDLILEQAKIVVSSSVKLIKMLSTLKPTPKA